MLIHHFINKVFIIIILLHNTKYDYWCLLLISSFSLFDIIIQIIWPYYSVYIVNYSIYLVTLFSLSGAYIQIIWCAYSDYMLQLFRLNRKIEISCRDNYPGWNLYRIRTCSIEFSPRAIIILIKWNKNLYFKYFI